MNSRKAKRYLGILVVLALGLLASCRLEPAPTTIDASQTNQGNPSPRPTPLLYEPGVDVPEFLKQIPFRSKAEAAGMIAAWKKIPDHDHFRTVRHPNSQQAVNDYGEIAGAYGLALFVVDITKAELERFGLIIMLERPADRYDIYWIFRDRDFTNFQLSRSSGSLFVWHPAEDGKQTTCRIEWVRAKGRWTCE